MVRGLNIIATRSEGLSRFSEPMRAWRNCRGRVSIPWMRQWVSRVADLEQRRPDRVVEGGEPAQFAAIPTNSINC